MDAGNSKSRLELTVVTLQRVGNNSINAQPKYLQAWQAIILEECTSLVETCGPQIGLGPPYFSVSKAEGQYMLVKRAVFASSMSTPASLRSPSTEERDVNFRLNLSIGAKFSSQLLSKLDEKRLQTIDLCRRVHVE